MGAGLRLVALCVDVFVVAHVNSGLPRPAGHRSGIQELSFRNAPHSSSLLGQRTYRSREKVSCATDPARACLDTIAS